MLEPGKSETLTLSWKVEDMASYDTYGKGCYVLEKGDYIISINSDSHNIIDSQTYTVKKDVVYSEGRSTDQTPATNQFGFAENTEQITYLSRADGFANLEEATAACAVTEMAWNEDLAKEFGSSIGQMADEMNVSGWYAPAMNTHRSAFAGRNFEYYSEDGFLSGKMAANAVAGAKEHGVYSFIKHFALNDQETNRTDLLSTWSNEQAIREIYLKPFELAVKEGGAQAVMSAFNYIGNEYAGACNELLQNVLRSEWGFRGMVLTDYFGGYGYQDADIQIRNGGDFCLNPMGSETSVLTDQTSATSLIAARQACKNILFTTCNSRAYTAETLNPGLPGWQIVMYVIDAVIIALLAVWEFAMIKSYKKPEQVIIESK